MQSISNLENKYAHHFSCENAITKALENGMSETDADQQASAVVADWAKVAEADLAKRYEREIMNPEEALSLGSVSQIVMPSDLRAVIAKHLMFCLRHYTPEPMGGVQREQRDLR